MAASEARVTLNQPERYLAQLVKHFAHRRPVELAPSRGAIAFEGGRCALVAEAGALRLRVEAADAGSRARLEEVVARHLLRFAFRDPPEIRWEAED